MRKQRFMDQSTFICTTCRNKFPLMRNHGEKRSRGHIKDMWCPFCGTDRKFMEIPTGNYYVDENGKILY